MRAFQAPPSRRQGRQLRAELVFRSAVPARCGEVVSASVSTQLSAPAGGVRLRCCLRPWLGLAAPSVSTIGPYGECGALARGLVEPKAFDAARRVFEAATHLLARGGPHNLHIKCALGGRPFGDGLRSATSAGSLWPVELCENFATPQIKQFRGSTNPRSIWDGFCVMRWSQRQS